MTIRAVALCITFIISATQSCTVGLSPVISTTEGQVQGCVSLTRSNVAYFSYKGIPYAKAPIGQNRFKPPEKVESWSGVLSASADGNSCPQIHPIYRHYVGDEDCLYLNVFAPKKSRNLAVMVWIHGGSFKEGSGNTSMYGPDNFIERNIIVVTINYRLSALGFLAVRHPDATGNAGLKDQNAALRWVRRNIASFGGDPNKVTLVGESAGGVSAHLHVLSPMSNGLFRSLITMSGTPLNIWAMQCLRLAEQRAFKLGSLLDCKTRDATELLNCLYNIEARDLVNASTHIVMIDSFIFGATIEDSSLAPADQIFLSECPMEVYKSDKFRRLPQIIGFTRDEFLRFISPDLINYIARMIDFPLKVLNCLGELITLNNYITHSPSEMCSNDGTARNVLSDLVELLRKIMDFLVLTPINIMSDVFFIGAIDAMQRMLYETYYYVVSFNSPYATHRTVYNIQLNGVGHEDDNGYIFEMDKKYFNYTPEFTTEDSLHSFLHFKRKMSMLWANFINYNDPTPNGVNDTLLNVKWLPTGTTGRQLDLNNDFVMKDRQVRLAARIVGASTYYLFGDTFSGCDTMLCTILHLP